MKQFRLSAAKFTCPEHSIALGGKSTAIARTAMRAGSSGSSSKKAAMSATAVVKVPTNSTIMTQINLDKYTLVGKSSFYLKRFLLLTC